MPTPAQTSEEWWVNDQTPDNPFGKSDDYEAFLNYVGSLGRSLTPAIAQQPLVITHLLAQGMFLPGVIAAGVHIHDHAQLTNSMGLLVALDECVPHPDCLAKYAAAFFKMSRSSVTRLSSAFRRRNSSVCDSCSCR